jgi:hypothetical protein
MLSNMAPARGHGAIAPRGPKNIKKEILFFLISKTHQITNESIILTPD